MSPHPRGCYEAVAGPEWDRSVLVWAELGSKKKGKKVLHRINIPPQLERFKEIRLLGAP